MNSKRNKKFYIIVMFLVLTLSLSACLPGDGQIASGNTAGFFWGIWHGWMAPISLIFSIFNGSIRIYEVNNSGLGYDFGYYMAIISGFGGLSLARRKKYKE